MKRIIYLSIYLLSLQPTIGQVIRLQYLVDSTLLYRNDTTKLFDSWCRAGYCGANWMYGNSNEYLALGDEDTVKKTITRYIGMFVRFGKDQYEFRNRCAYYCTADKNEYNSWQKEVELLGYKFQESKKEDYSESSIYSKGPIYITLRRDMKEYRIWEQSKKRKGMYTREAEAEDDKIPSFVAFIELKPVIMVDELLSYFDRYRDTTAIKKALFDRGYSIAIKDANFLNVLGIGDERQTNYNESLSLGLSKLEPALIYQTDYEFLFKTWEPYLLEKGYKEVEVAKRNLPGERYFQKQNILIGIAKVDKTNNRIGYRIFIKKTGLGS
jgi:hypothetical protein